MNNQQSLKNLFDSKLQSNSFNVDFRLDLFNSDDIDYYYENEDGERKRFCPVMIDDIVGEYLNIPNANSTSNETSLMFDLFVDYTEDLDDKITNEIAKINYNNTLNAIEEFKSSLLAQYFPLGTSYLYMGGEDSKFSIKTNLIIDPSVIYINFIPYNTDEETLWKGDTRYIQKYANDIRFVYNGTDYISIPYTVNEEMKFVVYSNTSKWVIEDDKGNSNEALVVHSPVPTTLVDVGAGIGMTNTGLEGLVKRIAYNDSFINSFDFNNIDDELTDFKVDIDTWNDKNLISNSGTYVLDTVQNDIFNSILWSEDGNAVFGFGTLSPTTDLRVVDGRYVYQAFELPITVFISNDVLFGNNFEYYLDGEQVFPVDRQHTLATETNGGQYLGTGYNEHIVEESSREHTLSFYYIPSKKLTSILKHVVSGNIEQNTSYTLLVQYPFFQVAYEVVLESGGTQPNINTISTFTVSLKRKDRNLA